jgi:hypothetical protein
MKAPFRSTFSHPPRSGEQSGALFTLCPPHCSRLTAPDHWPPITRFTRSGRGEGCFLRRQKPPRTRPIVWPIPFEARITAHAGSEHYLRPTPSKSHTLTHSIVRCAPPEGIPIFFGVEKSIPHPGPLPHGVFTVYRSLITLHFSLLAHRTSHIAHPISQITFHC